MTVPAPRRVPLLLLAATGLAYANSLGASFQFDDFNVIVDNPAVHSWAAWREDAGRGIRPLLKASYTANWVAGTGAAGFHLVNVLIHAANVLLVYALGLRWLAGSRTLDAAAARAAAGLAALLFAVHPVQTEAVTYVSGRSVSLMALCYLGALLAYVRGSEPGARRSAGGLLVYGVSPALFACAVATRETAVTLPAALLLWEATARPPVAWREVFRRQVVHWAALAALAVLFVLPRYGWLLDYSLALRSPWANLLTQVQGVTYLLSRLVLVSDLNIDPDLPVLTRWTALAGVEAAGLLLSLGGGVASLRRRPWLAFGLLWVFLHLAPTNSLLPRLDVANERQLYLPLWGLAFWLATEAARLSVLYSLERPAESGWLLRGAAGALVVVLVWSTAARNRVYATEVALWEDAAAKSPGKARVFNNLGYAYRLAGRPEAARRAFEAALTLDPTFVLARGNLAALPPPAPGR